MTDSALGVARFISSTEVNFIIIIIYIYLAFWNLLELGVNEPATEAVYRKRQTI